MCGNIFDLRESVGFIRGQCASPLTDEASPRGDDDLETALSVLSELDPLWLRRSADVAVEEDELVEEDKGFAFSLKSVMMTVKSPTVTSKCCALLLSTFFNLGLSTEKGGMFISQSNNGKKILLNSKLIMFGAVLLTKKEGEAVFPLQSIGIKELLKIAVN